MLQFHPFVDVIINCDLCHVESSRQIVAILVGCNALFVDIHVVSSIAFGSPSVDLLGILCVVELVDERHQSRVASQALHCLGSMPMDVARVEH